jgi:hypothetical protein
MSEDIDKQHEEEMRKIDRRMSEECRLGDFNRARSITVGTAFGGTTEIGMRCNDGRFVWSLMQPVEVIELIHQLAANVGCHINLAPRRDFSSWRDWRVSEEERLHLNGHPPFPNDMALHMGVGKQLGYENLPGDTPVLRNEDYANNQAVAVERPDDGRSADGAAGAS